MDRAEHYEGREQSLIKHEILRRYLQRFALIVGSKWDAITYIDCFAGPWNVQSEDLADSSFAIALDQLRTARDDQAKRGRELQLRCFFIEKNAEAFAKLNQFARQIKDAVVHAENASFEDSIPAILKFVRESPASSFPFIFIDPTGWTGIAIETIAPLLRLKPGEVLVNFMSGFIHRFITSPHEQTQLSFLRLFGSPDAKMRVQNAPIEQRASVAVEEYCKGLKKEGGFRYTCCAYVLHPQKDRTYFNLIYATRHAKGVEVFKETEKKAMASMEQARATAQMREREKRTKQKEMFAPAEMPSSEHYAVLRSDLLERAREKVVELMHSTPKVPYDVVWETAISYPLVWESDLKTWIQDWCAAGKMVIDGLRERERVPKRGQHHSLVWSG